MPKDFTPEYAPGAKVDPNDPNDPFYLANSQDFEFVGGQWRLRTDNALGTSTAITNAVAPGAIANTITPGSPGATLDTGQADADRTRLGGYLEQLTNQANTGAGAWEQALAQNTAATQSNAEALGQTAGLDPMNAARNVENAQSGAAQRGVGQGRLLRAQTQQQAQGQLADVLGGQGALDAQQAAGVGAVNQGVRATNVGEEQRAKKAELDAYSGLAQTAMAGAGMSNGGRVPGEPQVMADSPINDTVEAESTEGADLKLSPGEIIIPLSIAESPNAPELAAAFVEAVKARGATPGRQNFDTGGQLPPISGAAGATTQLAHAPQEGEFGSTVLAQSPDGKTQAPSIANGGLLDVEPYNATREANLANTDRLMAAYGGTGPSVAPQAMQNATDATLADAMRAQAGSRSGPMDVTAQAAEQSQGAAGNAAGIVAGESQRAGEAFAQALQRQRAQDLAFATAKQQAAWRNTMMNAGISLEQQNQLKSLLGSAGTGAVAVGGLFDKGGDDKPYHYDTGTSRYDTTPAWENPGTASSPSDWEQPFAEGGVVAHLSRQGTRKKPSRPGAVKESRGWSDPRNPAGAGGPEEWSTYDKGSAKDPRTQREQEGPEQHFADGGEVSTYERLRKLLAGSSASPIQFDTAGIPISKPAAGPFPEELPPPRMMTPQEIAAADVRKAQPRQLANPPVAPQVKPAPPPVALAPAPVAPVRVAPRPVAPSPSGKLRDAAGVAPDQFALANQAGEQKAAAETTQADATAAALMEGQRALEANAIDQKERQARASAMAQQQLGVIQQAREDMKRIDTTVDTGRMWRDRSIPGKIFSIIGLVAGAIGNDNGVNRAAALLNQQIDRDIDAQKSSFELALRKGQSAVTSAESLYGLSRQAAQDDIAASLAAKCTALDLVGNKVALAAAKAGSPMAKANLTALHAKVMADKDAADKAAHARLQDMGLKWYAAKTDRIAAERPTGANTLTANFVAPGYALAEGAHPKPEELAKWREARAAADDIKAKATQLREMISTGKLSGASRFGGDEKAKAEALMGSLKVSAKNAYELGALSGSDMDLVMSQIANPVGLGGLFTGDKTMASKLDQFIKNTDQTVTKKGDALGIVKEGAKPASGGQDDAGARAWLADPKNANSPMRAKVQAKLEGR